MNRTTTAILVAIVAMAGLGVFVLLNKSDTTEPATTQNTSDTDSINNTPAANTNTTTTQALATDEVEIENSAFKQNNITVKKGATVTWTNKDSVQHTVTPDQASDNFKGSELLSKGESYSFTFNTVGTYAYHCTPHPFMKGTVTVTE